MATVGTVTMAVMAASNDSGVGSNGSVAMTRRLPLVLGGFLAAALTLPALAWEEPARSSQERRDLMNAVRPWAEAQLKPPVEFVVNSLRRDGNVAFASLCPQRPGGAPIAWEDTALHERGEAEEWYDGIVIHVLYQRQGGIWRVFDSSIGATDVWWSDPTLCATFAPVTPEVC